jgi:hypothetical protein
MLSELGFARVVQGVFWFGIILHLVSGIVYGYDTARVIVITFVIAISTLIMIFYIRCQNCGESFFVSPNKSWKAFGVNLFPPVSSTCKNCGHPRR